MPARCPAPVCRNDDVAAMRFAVSTNPRASGIFLNDSSKRAVFVEIVLRLFAARGRDEKNAFVLSDTHSSIHKDDQQLNLKRTPLRHTRDSAASRTQSIACAAIAAASALCFANAAFAAPGAPNLSNYEITSKPHGFVEIDLQRAGNAPYKDLVKLNKKVDVPLPFNIWSNPTAVKAVAVIDGVVDPSSEIRMTPGGAQSGTVVANVKTPGVKKMQVRVTDKDGTSTDSAALDVMVFDTLPELADTLPDNASKANKPFANTSGSVVGTYFATWSIYDRKFNVDNVPVENLTHMLYGFVPICGGENVNGSLAQGAPGSFRTLQQTCAGLPDYSVAIHDTWGEMGVTLPGQNANSKLKGVLGQMMAAKKRNPDLKILPSVGG